HVRVDQRLLEPLPGLVLEALEDRRLELRPERLPALRHVVPKPREEPAPLLLGLRLGRSGAVGARHEELAPAPCHQGRNRSACSSTTSGFSSGRKWLAPSTRSTSMSSAWSRHSSVSALPSGSDPPSRRRVGTLRRLLLYLPPMSGP